MAKTKTKTSTKTRNAARSTAKTASRKPKASSGKTASTPGKRSVGAAEVTLDRRCGTRRQEAKDNKPSPAAVVPPQLERRKKVNRRRQIDPTTCERDYTDDEVLFMNALDDYKRTSGRMFPTCSEVLEVVRSLGYVRLSPSDQAPIAAKPLPHAAANESDAHESAVERDWR